MGAITVGDTLGNLIVGYRVESSYADDQTAWITEAIGLERVVSFKSSSLSGGIASAVKGESNLIFVLRERDSSGINLDAFLESIRLVCWAGADDVPNTSGVEALLKSSALAGCVLSTNQSRSKDK